MFDLKTTLGRLGELAAALFSAGVVDRKSFATWSRENKETLSDILEYHPTGTMPDVTTLVDVDFHPTQPLVLFNYTKTAHALLHQYEGGWTAPLRVCRGTVFDCRGNLVIFSFPKFFNHTQNPDPVPSEPFSVMKKMDGHLVAIAKYNGNIIVTTRGRFMSPTSKLASELFSRHVETYGWDVPDGMCLATEFIHPDTHVFVDYRGEENFYLLSAFDVTTCKRAPYYVAKDIAKQIHLPMVEIVPCGSLAQLIEFVKDQSVSNQEGFVVHFYQNDQFLKFKFETYISLMKQEKLSFHYLMNQLMAGTLDEYLLLLPDEIVNDALVMLGKILQSYINPKAKKPREKWQALYTVFPDGATSHQKSICRKFVRFMTAAHQA